MAKFEKVKCEMLPQQLLLWKYPKTLFDKAVELTVDDGYTAVVNIGGNLTLVQPGKQILPLQNKEAGLSAEIYFVRVDGSNRYHWGTKPNIEINDPIYNVTIRLMGYGTVNVAIQNPLLLVQNAKCGRFPLTGDPLPEFFRNQCLQALQNSIFRLFGMNRVSLLYAPQYIQEIRSQMKELLKPLLNPLGLDITRVIINSLEVVPDNNSIYVWNSICEAASKQQAAAAQKTAQTAANYYQSAQTYAAYYQTQQPAPAYNNANQPAPAYSQRPVQQPAPAKRMTAQPIQPDIQAPIQQSEPMNFAADSLVPQSTPIADSAAAPQEPPIADTAADPFVPQETPVADSAADSLVPQEPPIADTAAEDMNASVDCEEHFPEEAPSPEPCAPDESSKNENPEAEPAAFPEEPIQEEIDSLPDINAAPVNAEDQGAGSEQPAVPQIAKYCPYCGQGLYKGDRFCVGCGKLFPEKEQ